MRECGMIGSRLPQRDRLRGMHPVRLLSSSRGVEHHDGGYGGPLRRNVAHRYHSDMLSLAYSVT